MNEILGIYFSSTAEHTQKSRSGKEKEGPRILERLLSQSAVAHKSARDSNLRLGLKNSAITALAPLDSRANW